MLSRLADRASWVAILVLALWIVATGILVGVMAYAPTPFSDQWDHVLPEQLDGRLFAPHNEHRIVLARIVFAIDLALTHGAGVLGVVLVYLFSLGNAALLVFLASRTWADASPGRHLLAAFVAASFALYGFQFENFASGFQLVFPAVYFFGSVAIVAAARACGGGSRPWAWGLAAGAAYALSVGCMANGLLVGPILVAIALVFRAYRAAGLFSALTIALWTMYFVGLGGAERPSMVATLLANPAGVVGNALAYLGAPVASPLFSVFQDQAKSLFAARAFGLLAVVCVSAAIFRWVSSRSIDAPRAAWIGLAVFILASVLVTVLGRVCQPEITMLSNRYGATTAVLWGGLATCAVYGLRGPRSAPAVRVALVACLLAFAATQLTWVVAGADFRYRKKEAEAGLLSGVDAPSVFQAVYPAPDKPIQMRERLREGSIAMFAAPWTRLVGTTLSPAPDRACPMTAVRSALVPDGSVPTWKLTVHARVPGRVRGIAVLDDQGEARGVLIRGLRGDDASTPWGRGAAPQWAGYVTTPSSAGDLKAVGVDARGRPVCLVGTIPGGQVVGSAGRQG
jgi:hypothetical protein